MFFIKELIEWSGPESSMIKDGKFIVGKYKNKTIEWVIDNDIRYIL